MADAFVKRAEVGRAEEVVEGDGRLKGGKGGTWWMRCRLVRGKCMPVGDHVIVVGEVLECGTYEGGAGIGLVYAEGVYLTGRLGT